ncbi:GDP-L-fucose synthetase [Besnoitia besnoiti]|uniref:GDP-L-fucose synthase n=1 Tax=Besnoitia besnoiti TaxID=94643 RepID=A0A2A9MFJ9_BESBE|nr:GDP-L-fucose synthetase [Besnoitia besnoiti]PFH34736.1 GDP-L-fucose synthetase [Besnoitia besnoiti]
MDNSPHSTSRLPVCLVTGGTGLVGQALQSILRREQTTSLPSSSPSSSSPCSSSCSSSSCSSSSCSSSERHAGVETVRLCGRGFEFIFVGSREADLRSFEPTEALFLRYRPVALIHLAARVGGLFDNMSHNLEFFEDNMHINDNVVRLAHRFRVTRAVFCLSTCIFPAHCAESGEVMREEQLHTGAPHPSNEGYSYAKRMLEVSVRLHRRRFGYAWRCVCPTNLYGPFDQFSLERAHVLPALVHKAFLASRHKTPFVVGGSGAPLRQFVFSEDAGEVILRVLQAPTLSEEESFMILAADADQNEPSIAYLAEVIADNFGLKNVIEFDRSKPDGIFRKTVSNARLRRFLGPKFQFLSLEEGVRRTVAWFVQNAERARM